jgi:hypothetical protein
LGRQLAEFPVGRNPLSVYVRSIMPPIGERAIAFAGMEL